MFTTHFFKGLILFTGLILLGLLGIFLVSHFGIAPNEKNIADEECDTEVC